MNTTDYEKLERSLGRLKDQHEFYKANEETLSGNIKEAVKESVIQRFETCYDTFWKHLKKHLEEHEMLVNVPNSPNGIFRTAHEVLLMDKETLKRFMEYVDARRDTTHDYDEKKVEKAFGKTGNFIQDVTDIYEKMVDAK